MKFTKMHGLGNDYVYIDAINQDLSRYDLPCLSQVLSDRNFGIGGDGIILILPSDTADFRMRILNSDGSEAEMCGNGVRCFSRFVYDHGLTDKTELAVETGAGIIRPVLTVQDGTVSSVRVDMGEPRLKRGEIPVAGEPADQPVENEPLVIGDTTYHINCVSMGNPHCVIFVDEITDEMVLRDGPRIETHPLFPAKINVEFARVAGPGEVHMRVWERGAGETLACGTGACATAVAAHKVAGCKRTVTVHLRGGDLEIEWADNGHIFMTGPATTVFSGEINEELLAQAVR